VCSRTFTAIDGEFFVFCICVSFLVIYVSEIFSAEGCIWGTDIQVLKAVAAFENIIVVKLGVYREIQLFKRNTVLEGASAVYRK